MGYSSIILYFVSMVMFVLYFSKFLNPDKLKRKAVHKSFITSLEDITCATKLEDLTPDRPYLMPFIEDSIVCDESTPTCYNHVDTPDTTTSNKENGLSSTRHRVQITE